MLSESGLYALIFKSRKPEAKKFRKWITVEVIPSLRRTGKYEMGQDNAPADFDLHKELYSLLTKWCCSFRVCQSQWKLCIQVHWRILK
jgi:prophage antirepressor-like protein